MRRKPMTKEDKMMQYDTDHKVYCTNPYCNGHGIAFKRAGNDRLICNNCGHYIYKDKKTELKYKLLERGVKIDN